MLSLQIVSVALVLFSVSANACVCPKIYRPFCGTDGKTYDNKCLLVCAIERNSNLKIQFPGKCPGSIGQQNAFYGNRNQPPREYSQNQNYNVRPTTNTNYRPIYPDYRHRQYPTASALRHYPTISQQSPGYPTLPPPRRPKY